MLFLFYLSPSYLLLVSEVTSSKHQQQQHWTSVFFFSSFSSFSSAKPKKEDRFQINSSRLLFLSRQTGPARLGCHFLPLQSPVLTSNHLFLSLFLFLLVPFSHKATCQISVCKQGQLDCELPHFKAAFVTVINELTAGMMTPRMIKPKQFVMLAPAVGSVLKAAIIITRLHCHHHGVCWWRRQLSDDHCNQTNEKTELISTCPSLTANNYIICKTQSISFSFISFFVFPISWVPCLSFFPFCF